MSTPYNKYCGDCPSNKSDGAVPLRTQICAAAMPFWLLLKSRLAWAYVKYWLWQIVTKLILGVIYFALISEGLRLLFPTLGTKLCKLPGLADLYEYESTHRLDLAHPLSILVLTFVWMLWSAILQMWLDEDESFDHQGWRPCRHTQLIVILGIVLLTADAALFYAALAELSWNGSWFSATAFFATAAYMAVLIFVTLVSITLHKNIVRIKHQDYRP